MEFQPFDSPYAALFEDGVVGVNVVLVFGGVLGDRFEGDLLVVPEAYFVLAGFGLEDEELG